MKTSGGGEGGEVVVSVIATCPPGYSVVNHYQSLICLGVCKVTLTYSSLPIPCYNGIGTCTDQFYVRLDSLSEFTIPMYAATHVMNHR
jgi:hypothetical protein